MNHVMIRNLKPISCLIHLWNICGYYVFIVHIFFKFNKTWLEPNLSTNSWNFLFAKKMRRNRKFNCGALNQKRAVKKLSENCVFHGMHSKILNWKPGSPREKLLHEFMISIDLIISKWINWTNENQASSILSSIKINILFQPFHRRTIRTPHVYFCAQKIMLSHLIGCRKSVDARYQYIGTVGMDTNVGTCVSNA